MEAAFDGAGCAVPKGHGDEAGALAHPVHSGPKGHRVGLPFRSGPEVTAGLSEHPHPSAEHVVAVHLLRRDICAELTERRSRINGGQTIQSECLSEI